MNPVRRNVELLCYACERRKQHIRDDVPLIYYTLLYNQYTKSFIVKYILTNYLGTYNIIL